MNIILIWKKISGFYGFGFEIAWFVASQFEDFWVWIRDGQESDGCGWVFAAAAADEGGAAEGEVFEGEILVLHDDGGFGGNGALSLKLTFQLLKSKSKCWIHKNLWSKWKLHSLLRVLLFFNLNSGQPKHFVCPIIKIELCLCGPIWGKPFL